jgi:hypothetical protein
VEIGPGLDICCADGEPLEPGVRCGAMGRSRALGDFTKNDTDYGLLNIASGQLTNLLTLKRMATVVLMETHLPTLMTVRVYVNLPEGIIYIIL